MINYWQPCVCVFVSVSWAAFQRVSVCAFITPKLIYDACATVNCRGFAS